jgi:hypothetical protein
MASHAFQYSDASWFVRVLIVRGIGYRAFSQKNDFADLVGLSADFLNQLRPFYSCAEDEQSEELNITKAVSYEFTSPRYLIIRAGHTLDLCAPLHPWSMTVTKKKDRKLIVVGFSSNISGALAKRVHRYRPPSAYTGRGARIKHVRPVRKAGKKDKQKGKIF